ncbi:ABC transporter family substrate-binding protein [Rhodococcus triatomae]|nr:ABC transporter family substrate-binding protein [Rhodococcus triatomae]QNG21192.1 ABC transporter family substrate-binding protein [Rhodococcus triatomae]QNG25518.1 ABC transporter family substrate-binding protein [Rhodococcus triatomae]
MVTAVSLAACTANPPPPVESTDTPRTTSAPSTRLPVVVAIDDIGTGFNPHLLADQSPANAAVSSLVFPSPFRTVPSPDRPGFADHVLDPSLLVTAEVSSQEPFTVTYRLRTDAQWSDGAPIAAEDFRYLWQQMITVPGVVDPAGYRLIRDVNSSGGGKTVNVVFDAPYPAWRELFTDLLPAHLVKDSPGGFAGALAENIPVSGSRFHIKSIDRGRDEILLERNDRFWDTPAAPDQILLRRAGSSAQLADSIRTGDAQLAQTHGGTSTAAQLAAIPAVRTGSVFQPRTLEVTLNGRVPELDDIRVRRAVLGVLDVELLATVGSGSESTAVPARSLVFSPSDPGYAPSAPDPIGPEQVQALLAEAGYERQPEAAVPPGEVPEGGLLERNGLPLTLVIGVPSGDATAAAVAATAADQLRGAGVDASVESIEAEELFGEAITSGRVGAVVAWARAGGDAATVAASRFGCLPAPQESDDEDAADTTRAPEPTEDGDGSDPETDTETDAEKIDAELASPSNLSGLCDPALQPAIDSSLRGVGDVPTILSDVDRRLWDLEVVLPVVQDSTLVAAGPGVQGASLGGVLPAGIFDDAAQWTRAVQ